MRGLPVTLDGACPQRERAVFSYGRVCTACVSMRQRRSHMCCSHVDSLAGGRVVYNVGPSPAERARARAAAALSSMLCHTDPGGSLCPH